MATDWKKDFTEAQLALIAANTTPKKLKTSIPSWADDADELGLVRTTSQSDAASAHSTGKWARCAHKEGSVPGGSSTSASFAGKLGGEALSAFPISNGTAAKVEMVDGAKFHARNHGSAAPIAGGVAVKVGVGAPPSSHTETPEDLDDFRRRSKTICKKTHREAEKCKEAERAMQTDFCGAGKVESIDPEWIGSEKETAASIVLSTQQDYANDQLMAELRGKLNLIIGQTLHDAAALGNPRARKMLGLKVLHPPMSGRISSSPMLVERLGDCLRTQSGQRGAVVNRKMVLVEATNDNEDPHTDHHRQETGRRREDEASCAYQNVAESTPHSSSSSSSHHVLVMPFDAVATISKESNSKSSSSSNIHSQGDDPLQRMCVRRNALPHPWVDLGGGTIGLEVEWIAVTEYNFFILMNIVVEYFDGSTANVYLNKPETKMFEGHVQQYRLLSSRREFTRFTIGMISDKGPHTKDEAFKVVQNRIYIRGVGTTAKSDTWFKQMLIDIRDTMLI